MVNPLHNVIISVQRMKQTENDSEIVIVREYVLTAVTFLNTM